MRVTTPVPSGRMPTSHAAAELAARSGPDWYPAVHGPVEIGVFRRTSFVDVSIC
jgi:hypothetical protein